MRDSHCCVSCGAAYQVGDRAFPVDHIVPYRISKTFSDDPNSLENLMTLCRSCHSTKTGFERYFLAGDMFAYVQLLIWKLHLSEDRMNAAFQWCGLMEVHEKRLWLPGDYQSVDRVWSWRSSR
jgi:hypothetical protein